MLEAVIDTDLISFTDEKRKDGNPYTCYVRAISTILVWDTERLWIVVFLRASDLHLFVYCLYLLFLICQDSILVLMKEVGIGVNRISQLGPLVSSVLVWCVVVLLMREIRFPSTLL